VYLVYYEDHGLVFCTGEVDAIEASLARDSFSVNAQFIEDMKQQNIEGTK